MLPFQTLVAENRELGLVVAVLIGFGFGFVLERAGFGKATKLAAQFYLHDMTVFKVMFGAIITAMSGMAIAGGLGLVDFRAVSEAVVSYTYLWPMLVGGLVLGAGFIISGYCPGTSVVGMASGHLDAVLTFTGVIVGSVIYGELYPALASFHVSGEKGFLFLYDLVNIPAPLLTAIIVAVALSMFLGAEKVEAIFKRKRGEEIAVSSVTKRARVFAFGTIGGLAAIAVVTMALPREPSAAVKRTAASMSQEELARRILDKPWSVRILDLRDRKKCEKARIPGSECTPMEMVDKLGLAYAAGARDLVLVATKTAVPVPSALAYPGRVYLLGGGFDGWKKFALTKPETPSADADQAAKDAYTFRASLNAAMTGRKPAPPPPAANAAVPQRKKKKGGGCS